MHGTNNVPVEVDGIYRSLYLEVDLVPWRHSITFFTRRKAREKHNLECFERILREFKPDIVHTHAAKSGALGRLAAKHSNVPVIVHTFHGHIFHSYFNSLKTNFFIRTERYLGSLSDAIVAISDVQKKELSKDFRIV